MSVRVRKTGPTRYWTDKEEATLIAMRAAKEPREKIAKTLNRSVESITGKTCEINFKLRRPPVDHAQPPAPVVSDDRKHLRLVLAQGGFTWKELARKAA